MPVGKIQFIRDLTEGEKVSSLFLINQAILAQSRNGPFWRIEFKDNSGVIDAKIWSPFSLNFKDIPAGIIAEVSGRVTSYKGKLEITVEDIYLLSEEEQLSVNMLEFLTSSAKKTEDMLDELEDLCEKNFIHPPWKKFIKSVLDSNQVKNNLPLAPGAKGLHHAYCGGLLEHTITVARLCMFFADIYPELDRQLLLAGAICHDLGKLLELTGGAVTEYTDEGRLLGHIALGLEIIEPHLNKSALDPKLIIHLKHLILSHHGELEFGSPKRPKTPEAFALHIADNLDARMAQCRDIIGAMPEQGSNWSSFQNTLGRFLYRAYHTPAQLENSQISEEEAANMDKANDRGMLSIKDNMLNSGEVAIYERNNDISSENVFGTDNIDPGWYGENAGGDSGFIKVNGYEEAGKKQDEAVHSLKEETEVKGDKKNKMDDKQHSLL